MTAYENMENFLDNYNNIYKRGFLGSEQKDICEKLEIDYNTYIDKLGINTAEMVDGQVLNYYEDVLVSLVCVLEDRDKTIFEWD